MALRTAIAFACLLSATPAAAADVEVSSPEALREAVTKAKPGDRILVAPGEYAALDLRRRRFSEPLTVAARDADAAPEFSTILLSGARGVVLSNLRIVYGPTEAPLSTYAVNIVGGEDIRLSGLEISSAANGVAGDDAYGVNIRDSARIVVEGGSFHDVYRAVAVLDSDDIEISRNVIRGVGSDGVVARGSRRLSILDNDFADFAIIDLDIQHPDAIQLWSRGAARANEDVTIRGNLIRRGLGDRSQGIFVKTPEIATRNIVIEDNTVEQSMAQGIFVENGDGVVIRNNTVVPAERGDRPGVEIRAPSSNAVVMDNIAVAYRFAPGVEQSRNRAPGRG